MATIRFGGELGTVTVKGKQTEARCYGIVDGDEGDDTLGERTVTLLRALVQRSGYDLAPALEDSAALAAELESRLGVRVSMLGLSAME